MSFALANAVHRANGIFFRSKQLRQRGEEASGFTDTTESPVSSQARRQVVRPASGRAYKHFKLAPSEIVERFLFHSRSRRQGESVATFVAELRSLAEFCNFKDTLEVMLRDRIVCGINDDAIQKRLLSERGLDYAKAAETAMNMETAARSTRGIRTLLLLCTR